MVCICATGATIITAVGIPNPPFAVADAAEPAMNEMVQPAMVHPMGIPAKPAPAVATAPAQPEQAAMPALQKPAEAPALAPAMPEQNSKPVAMPAQPQPMAMEQQPVPQKPVMPEQPAMPQMPQAPAQASMDMMPAAPQEEQPQMQPVAPVQPEVMTMQEESTVPQAEATPAVMPEMQEAKPTQQAQAVETPAPVEPQATPEQMPKEQLDMQQEPVAAPAMDMNMMAMDSADMK